MNAGKSVGALLRHVTINGEAAPDARLVIVGDGRGVLIGRRDGVVQALATATHAEWETNGSTISVVTEHGTTWAGQRDTRCGSCGGRAVLRTIDAKPFLPQPAYGDTY